MPSKHINIREYSLTGVGVFQLVRSLSLTTTVIEAPTTLDEKHLVVITPGHQVTVPSPIGAKGRIYIIKNTSGGAVQVKDTTLLEPLTLFTIAPNDTEYLVSTSTEWISIKPL